jgi:glycosyltransferase involved in cell wall biosynthesis
LLDSSVEHQPRFADLLREIFEFGQHGNLSASLASEKAVRLLSEAWADRWPDSAHAAPNMHDAVTAMQLLDHFLRPLSHPPVQADIAHAVANGLGVLPALAAKWRYDVPIIVTEHGVYLREQYMQNRNGPYRWPVKAFYLGFMRRLCALAYNEATTITPGNVYNRRWEERLGADPVRIRTVYNGVDPANFPALDGEPETPTISWVGRVDPIKDLETLLRAFALVRQEMPEARLRMFGSAPKGRESYLQRCQALAVDLGVDKAATFEGRVEDIRDAYDAGNIVALSSVSEGFPYSLIEAMTCGRACVATDVGGVTEAVGDTGLVVPPRSPAPLAEACLALLRNGEARRRLGAAARNRALENFTVDTAINTFDEIYSYVGYGRPLPTAVTQPAVGDQRGDLLPRGATG